MSSQRSTHMNTEHRETDWSDLKGKIKNKWGQFLDSDIDSFKENMDTIPDRIQRTYGYSKEKADQEYGDFKKSISNLEKPTNRPM